MKILTSNYISENLDIKPRTLRYRTKQAKDKNQDHITIKGKTFHFRTKLVGKGYEFSEVPFNEHLTTDKSSLKASSKEINTDNTKDVIIVNPPADTYSNTYETILNNLSTEERIKLDLKVAVVKAWGHNKMLPTQSKLKEPQFIDNFKINHADEIEMIGGFNISRKTIRDYKKAYEKNGRYGLLDKRGRKKGENYKIDDWVLELVSELYKTKKGFITTKNIYTILNKEAYNIGELSDAEFRQTIERATGGIISQTRIRTITNELKVQREMKYLSNPDKFKNSYLPAFGDMRAKALYANHYWEIDSTQLDAFAKNHENSEIETTWNIIAISDVKTAMKVVGFVKNSNSQGIAELLYKAFNKLGMPEYMVTDNGKDYLSNHIIGLLERFGIGHVRTAPYSGEEKPFVERHFGTLQNTFTELLNNFKGHSVTQFQAINAQTATSDRLSGNRADKNTESIEHISKMLDKWIDNVYSNTYNSSLKNTPYKEYMKYEENIKRVNIENLIFALGKQTTATVGKKGIRLNKKLYNNMDGLLGSRLGDEFIMIVDLLDHNKGYLFETNGEWLCPLSTEAISREGAIEARNFYKHDQKEMEKRSKKLLKKHEDRNDIMEINEACENAFKDQTPIEMIGGNGLIQNAGNIKKLEEIGKDIQRYEEKEKIINSKANLALHQEALEIAENKEADKVKGKPVISYSNLLKMEA